MPSPTPFSESKVQIPFSKIFQAAGSYNIVLIRPAMRELELKRICADIHVNIQVLLFT